MKKSVLIFLLAQFVVSMANATISDVSESFTGPGIWCYDFSGAASYAKENETFFLVAYGRQGGGCWEL